MSTLIVHDPYQVISAYLQILHVSTKSRLQARLLALITFASLRLTWLYQLFWVALIP